MVIRYMLDTNVCIALIKSRPERMRIRFSGLSIEEVGISSIVAAELWHGAALSEKKRQNEAALRDFLDYVGILNWPFEASPIYGRIRAIAQKKGAPIGAMDLLIASHALWLDAVLVTENTKAFGRVPHLRVENWEARQQGVVPARKRSVFQKGGKD
ncbi:MAG: type II toxin-antitoxin system VapC family toxin [Thermodesulfobacteriota bacterium]